ncbi:glycosyltransferase [Patescibacteria group bacterium]|uniref:Putative glycosyltransferase n=1 Tax=viral metagenome TaxID=1070528 RepID=A0A6M3KRG4_9ZZZZ|nr:glycosyltransferase [Patescibacteria group bacterium]
MRLLFFYTRDRSSSAESFATEGLHALFSKMLEAGCVDEIRVVIDTYGTAGEIRYAPGYSCCRVNGFGPEILKPGDIVWIRGGFKPWLPFIDYCRKNNWWLLFYGANTGRERWPFWDVVFDDITGHTRIDANGRLWLDYRKPVNPDIFHRIDTVPEYDLCIGASHIHDKKGQWRGVKAAVAYREMYGKDLYCIIPGAMHRGVMTNGILEDIRTHDLDIELTGMLPRHLLTIMMNRSKVFAHLGSGGQGDRGPIEAMACGCPVIIGFPKYHSQWVNRAAAVLDDPDDFEEIAEKIHTALIKAASRKAISEHFEAEAGIETQSLPMIMRLFDVLRRRLRADRRVLEAFK